jgi:hypothetical protein
MSARAFYLDRFLKRVYGTEPFVQYCRLRRIAFDQALGAPMTEADYGRWLAVVERLPESEQGRVELELGRVHELAKFDAIDQMIAAAEPTGPPADHIPGGAALVLWFFLHHPAVFHEVFLHFEVQETDSWENARAPAGIRLDDLDAKRTLLAESLQEFFRIREGTGRFCTVQAYRRRGGYCFIAHLAGRRRLCEGFTETGEHTAQWAWPAIPLDFVYYPQDGTILLKARQRAVDKILELFHRFGRSVLGVELDQHCLGHRFQLDLFKRRFDPLPDAEDMQSIRVKAMHLVYPQRDGRRRLKLETLSSDEPFAIVRLLEEHAGSEVVLGLLAVVYVELQVTMQVNGGNKNYLIRLWPNRSNLSQNALSERFRDCLTRWGVYHAS